MDRKLIYYPDPILQTQAQEIEDYDWVVNDLIPNMKSVLNEHDGKGLAAPQVGESVRVLLAYETTLAKQTLHAMINPKILSTSENLRDSMEGCLSLPGVYGFVKRHKSITICYVDEQKNEQVKEIFGDFAVVLQHEIDHLDGILFTDRMSKKEFKRVKSDLADLKKCYKYRA